MERPVQAQRRRRKAKPPPELKRDGERNRSSEAGESILSRKAAIVPYVPVP